jgi:superoxide dismutase, Fe-Mn family
MIMMTRREALKMTTLAGAATAYAAMLPSATAQQQPFPTMTPHSTAATPAAVPGPFTLPPLPYAYDALEPYIDAETMHLHHDKHHQAYVNNLNKAITGLADWQDKSIEYILTNLDAVPEIVRTAVRNNGGGHYNHSLFWQMMKKDGGGEPKGELLAAIGKKFKSFDGFKAELTTAAMNRFGSGWAWLELGADKNLNIVSTPNQDTVFDMGAFANGTTAAPRTSPTATPLLQPLLGIDVWEHAYYLKYQNLRANYIAAWFNVVNWDFVSERYQKLMA